MLPQLEYARPGSAGEAVTLLSASGARALAGGQGLIPDLRTGRDEARLLVDIGDLEELHGWPSSNGGGHLRLGSLVTLSALAAAGSSGQAGAALVEAAAAVGDHQVRNRATLGGALLHRDHGLDLPAAALALDAQLEVRLPDRTLRLAAGDELPAGGLLTAVELPLEEGASAYERMAHPAGHRAVCGVAAWVKLGPGGTLAACRLAAAGGGRPAARLENAERAAIDGAAGEDLSAAVSRDVSSWQPVSDLAASADYRAHLAGVLAARAIERAIAAAGPRERQSNNKQRRSSNG